MPSQHFKEHDMKLSSLSFSDNESIPERYAFGKIDAQSHVALADNYLSLIHISEPTRHFKRSRMPSSA